ncbi:MAG: mannose-1-phosphate guanylyltransferase [Bacteroidota bacterium]
MNKKDNLFVVVMAGGSGTRFWPYSRSAKPKQFLDILGTGKSLLRMTVDRFEQICPLENIFIVTNKDYSQLTEEHLPHLPKENILLEPYRKNTAPCIAYASHKIKAINSDSVMVVTPADHAIFNEKEFFNTIEIALDSTAGEEKLLTLGIKPTRPETGYGYIQYLSNPGQSVKKVKTFTEKPNMELAEKFVESGDYLWNSGMFIWSTEAICHALSKYLSEINEVFEQGNDKYNTLEEAEFLEKAYSLCGNISIDYGLMEKAENVHVVLGDFGWSDLGSWESIYDQFEKDKHGNLGADNSLLINSENCLIQKSGDRLIVVEGQENLVVLDYDDVLVITSRGEGQKIKDIMGEVKSSKGSEYL